MWSKNASILIVQKQRKKLLKMVKHAKLAPIKSEEKYNIYGQHYEKHLTKVSETSILISGNEIVNQNLKFLHKNVLPKVIVKIISGYLHENLDIAYTIETKQILDKTLKDCQTLLKEKITKKKNEFMDHIGKIIARKLYENCRISWNRHLKNNSQFGIKNHELQIIGIWKTYPNENLKKYVGQEISKLMENFYGDKFEFYHSIYSGDIAFKQLNSRLIRI